MDLSGFQRWNFSWTIYLLNLTSSKIMLLPFHCLPLFACLLCMYRIFSILLSWSCPNFFVPCLCLYVFIGCLVVCLYQLSFLSLSLSLSLSFSVASSRINFFIYLDICLYCLLLSYQRLISFIYSLLFQLFMLFFLMYFQFMSSLFPFTISWFVH